eukprot:g1679.t1
MIQSSYGTWLENNLDSNKLGCSVDVLINSTPIKRVSTSNGSERSNLFRLAMEKVRLSGSSEDYRKALMEENLKERAEFTKAMKTITSLVGKNELFSPLQKSLANSETGEGQLPLCMKQQYFESALSQIVELPPRLLNAIIEQLALSDIREENPFIDVTGFLSVINPNGSDEHHLLDKVDTEDRADLSSLESVKKEINFEKEISPKQEYNGNENGLKENVGHINNLPTAEFAKKELDFEKVVSPKYNETIEDKSIKKEKTVKLMRHRQEEILYHKTEARRRALVYDFVGVARHSDEAAKILSDLYMFEDSAALYTIAAQNYSLSNRFIEAAVRYTQAAVQYTRAYRYEEVIKSNREAALSLRTAMKRFREYDQDSFAFEMEEHIKEHEFQAGFSRTSIEALDPERRKNHLASRASRLLHFYIKWGYLNESGHPSTKHLKRKIKSEEKPISHSLTKHIIKTTSTGANSFNLNEKDKRRMLSRLRIRLRNRSISTGHLSSLMDADRNDVISKKEFQRGLAMTGIRPLPSDSEIEKLFCCFDSNSDGTISWQELRSALESGQYGLSSGNQRTKTASTSSGRHTKARAARKGTRRHHTKHNRHHHHHGKHQHFSKVAMKEETASKDDSSSESSESDDKIVNEDLLSDLIPTPLSSPRQYRDHKRLLKLSTVLQSPHPEKNPPKPHRHPAENRHRKSVDIEKLESKMDPLTRLAHQLHRKRITTDTLITLMTNGSSGKVTRKEFAQGIALSGVRPLPSERVVNELFDKIDHYKALTLDYSALKKGINRWRQQESPRQRERKKHEQDDKRRQHMFGVAEHDQHSKLGHYHHGKESVEVELEEIHGHALMYSDFKLLRAHFRKIIKEKAPGSSWHLYSIMGCPLFVRYFDLGKALQTIGLGKDLHLYACRRLFALLAEQRRELLPKNRKIARMHRRKMKLLKKALEEAKRLADIPEDEKYFTSRHGKRRRRKDRHRLAMSLAKVERLHARLTAKFLYTSAPGMEAKVKTSKFSGGVDILRDRKIDEWRLQNIQRCFEREDKNGDGFLEMPEFMHMLKRQIRLSKDDAEEIWDLFDMNGDGVVEYEEYVNFLLTPKHELAHFFKLEQKNSDISHIALAINEETGETSFEGQLKLTPVERVKEFEREIEKQEEKMAKETHEEKEPSLPWIVVKRILF